MKLHPELKNCLSDKVSTHTENAVLLGIRVRLARNLQEFPFPNWANETQKKDVLSICQKAIKSLPSLKKPVYLSLSDLNELEKKLLLERHCISPELLESKQGTGIVIDKNKQFACMINEDDHLRLQILSPTTEFKRIWNFLDNLDSELEHCLEYAFSPEFGYLTACPTNLGTGMRASAMLHLPGLVLSETIKPTIRAFSEIGIAVRGLFGEQSKAIGNVFQVSNQSTLGDDEETLLTQLEKMVQTLIRKEIAIRNQLIKNDPAQLFDKISRAHGILRSSYSISHEEALTLLSFIRLGLDLGCFPQSYAKEIENLWLYVRPAHLQLTLDTIVSGESENIVRADFLRKRMSKFVDPVFNFNKE